MQPDNTNQPAQGANAATAPAGQPRDGNGGLATPAQVEQLADQLSACADALHECIIRDIQAYGGGTVPASAQAAARKLLDDEQVLRQQADTLYAEAVARIVRSLGASQQHILALTADAAEKLKKLAKLTDAMGLVGRVLEISAAALTGNPALIMRALEDMHHMLDYIAPENPQASQDASGAAPAASATPESADTPAAPGAPATPAS
jgi:hypothetical protein